MLAARNEHIKKTLLQAKKDKKVVISDRFTDSTYAYQVIGNKINQNLNIANKNYILKDLKPNLTIVLKSNLNSIFLRLKKRKNKNKFDELDQHFYIKAQNAFIKIAKRNKKSYVIFDSSVNDNSLERKILDITLKKLNY